MLSRLVIIAVLVAGTAIVAYLLQRRPPGEPTRGRWTVPTHLRRSDFDRPDAPWLVAVFTSATCRTCQGTWEKARHLASDTVAVQEVEVTADRAIHERYGIEAVPTTVVVDAEGAVRASFLGPPTATDLWAALAELRDPGSVPPSCHP